MFVTVDLHADAEWDDELGIGVPDIDVGDDGDGGGPEFIADDIQNRHIEGDLLAQRIITGSPDNHPCDFAKYVLDAVAS